MAPYLSFSQQAQSTSPAQGANSSNAVTSLHQTIAAFQGNSALIGSALASLGLCNGVWFTAAEEELMTQINTLIPKSTYRKTLISDVYAASNTAKKGFSKLSSQDKSAICAAAQQAYTFWSNQGSRPRALFVDIMMAALKAPLPAPESSSAPIKNPGPIPGQDSEYIF